VLAALRRVGQRGEQCEATLHMGDGFQMGGALDGPGPGLLPIGQGLDDEAGLRIVLGQQLGLGRTRLGKARF
jgi:hypothetical protein